MTAYGLAEESNAQPIWDLAIPAMVVESSELCLDVEAALRTDSASHQQTSLVVRNSRTGRVGSVSRRRFDYTMIGRFGFGRALLTRSTISELTDWDCVILPHTITLTGAVDAVLRRPASRRYDDLILQGPSGWRRLASGVVLEALAARLAWRAGHDELTGLTNRAAFFERLEQLSLRHQGESHIAVIFIDLDRMKAVNDTLGHNLGDALLVSVARRLSTVTRTSDVVARLGGDEFAIALTIPPPQPGETSDPRTQLTQIAQQYLAALRRVDPNLDPRAASTASIGAALTDIPSAKVGPQTLLREADLAMYRAKQAGGDRVVVTTGVGRSLDPGPADIAGLSLYRALKDGHLTVHYQPIGDLRSRRIDSVEALVRWNHPELGLLGAEEVLAAGRAETLLASLDLWVLRTAVQQLLSWKQRLGDQAPTWINVNLSDAGLGDPELSANVLAVLDDLGCPPEWLRLEIPETASLALAESAVDELTRLADAGVLLTLDDMGTAASSLGHLSAFPVAEMKIDRSFIGRMQADVRNHAVVQMLTNLAAGLNILVTAEGVETLDQLHALEDLGVDRVQGDLLARPAPAADIESLLAAAPTQAAH